MAKMWAGRTDGITDSSADSFNSSIGFDKRMYRQDIKGSIAHATMLGKQGIILPEEAELIIKSLSDILADIESGKLEISSDAEDIHMFIESILTERIGDCGKKLHTARSRNDQVALDVRIYLADEISDIIEMLNNLISVICNKADQYKEFILPGYTHLQRAQPILFGQQLMAYAYMFLRDKQRLDDSVKRIKTSPLGACALAGTTHPIDRFKVAELIGFDSVSENSIDSVSDRDFCVEFLSDASICMMHLSRFCEELILWSSWEFGFVRISDAFTTGSSIMPQKKNSDMAELIRGKTGRVYGDLISILTVLKGLPLAYNKDMQEDKESLFDGIDTLKACIDIFTKMLDSVEANPDNMRSAAEKGFINATDLADYLVRKGLPFRTAYKISGSIVKYCIENDFVLENLPIDKYKIFCDLIEDDVYNDIDLSVCVNKRTSFGGTSIDSVEKQISSVRSMINK